MVKDEIELEKKCAEPDSLMKLENFKNEEKILEFQTQ